MYTTCRVYSNANDLADLLIANRAEIEDLLRSVDGFQAHYLVKTGDGLTSITVCDSKTGTDESNARANEFVQAIATGMTVTKPQIFDGPTPIAFVAGKDV